MAELIDRAEWRAMLSTIESDILRYGCWWGEARRLRDAAGIHRLTPQAGARLVAALARAGYECEPAPFLYESQPLMIGRIGARVLADSIKELLPAIREADRQVPALATFRDASVARLALRTWPGRTPTDRPAQEDS